MFTNRPIRRLGERVRVAQPVAVRTVQPESAPSQHSPRPVTIVDVSSSGASLQMALDAEIVLQDVFDLGVDDVWGLVRVVWARQGNGEVLVCGVEFLDPHQAFLAALERWLGQVAVLRPAIPF